MTRKTQKKLRKLLTLVSCAVLLVCVTVVGTVAYLTAKTEVVTNTFTVGNVAITLDEAQVNFYGEKVDADGKTETEVDDWTAASRVTENTYKLVPGHNYVKDPTVHVTAGSEKCWLFVKVDNGISAIEAATTIATQMEENDWNAVEGENGVYAYETIVDASSNQVDVPVFGEFTLTGTANVAQYENAAIKVEAYAVQADGFDTAAAAWGAAKASWNMDKTEA